MCSLAVIYVLPLILPIAALDLNVTVTPWCSDSLRIQIVPSSSHAAPLPESALVDSCKPGKPVLFQSGARSASNGNLKVIHSPDGKLIFSRIADSRQLFSAAFSIAASTTEARFWAANMTLYPQDKEERIYGLGQGEWTGGGGCASGSERVVPLERNGHTVGLLQRKFHVTIPFAYSSSGYGFLFNMPGYGSVTVGNHGIGGMAWSAEAAPLLDFWVTTTPQGDRASHAAPIYEHYADATGHAPMLREDAMIFWQSRLRYLNTTTALNVTDHYAKLGLPVGVLVIDYYNQVQDGDFEPDPKCYPSLKTLSRTVQEKINASTVFSIWPEAKNNSAEYTVLKSKGCLINPDLGGLAFDTTAESCRNYIWKKFVKPRYFDQGISGYWLDETDGEGTQGGYDTSFGPAVVASNLWVNSWLRTFSEPVLSAGMAPLILTRGTWAGGQRHGIVLWSSDIESTFEELTAQINLGVHASLSGIPWWTSDVGGFGCGKEQSNESPYMRELIVRWYQFGLFCPIMRTHGCRGGDDPEPKPAEDVCYHGNRGCAGNEVWSYGIATQAILERYVRLRHDVLKPYIKELAHNVSARGVPTMRPLWWEFPDDPLAVGINDQYFLGPEFMVAPVTKQGAVSRDVYFPAGVKWQSFWDEHDVVDGGTTQIVSAPLDVIPVYRPVRSALSMQRVIV